MSDRITQNSGSGDPLARILDSIDRGLADIGDDEKIAINWILEYDYKMSRRAAVITPELFASGLGKIFGVGAKVWKERSWSRYVLPLAFQPPQERIWLL